MVSLLVATALNADAFDDPDPSVTAYLGYTVAMLAVVATIVAVSFRWRPAAGAT